MNNLLSKKADKEIGLVKCIEEVNTTIGGHGRLKTEQVKILLREGSKLYVVNTAHRVHLQWLQNVKKNYKGWKQVE